MAKADRLDVISPVTAEGDFKFWTPCRTGKMPTTGKPSEETLVFRLPRGMYQFKYKVEDFVGTLHWNQYDHTRYRDLITNIFLAMPQVFKRYKCKGTPFAVGVARRPSKKAWEFTLTGAGFKFEENFILAKLMDQSDFEELIWAKAIRMTYPGKRILAKAA